jgi:phosphoribosylformimino-5-aminoimidazole carboxamide ribonucleotide (ProFAR) isomerase
MQLIPSMDLLGGKVVRLRKGDAAAPEFFAVSPDAWIEQLAAAGAQRIHVVDLDGAFGKPRQTALAVYPARYSHIRFQLGGGLRTRADVAQVLDAGFDAVVGTLAIEEPQALAGLAAERLIAALDLRGQQLQVRGWTSGGARDAGEVGAELLALGIQIALVTDVERDGMLLGPGTAAADFIANMGFRVQVSGGIATLADVAQLRGVHGYCGAISGKALLDGRIHLSHPHTRAALRGDAW